LSHFSIEITERNKIENIKSSLYYLVSKDGKDRLNFFDGDDAGKNNAALFLSKG